MKPEELLHRLHVLRRETRVVVAVEGAARLAGGALAVACVALAVDWWVHVPAPLRAAATLVAVYFAALWFVRRVLTPLRRDIPLSEIAVRIDARHAELGNRMALVLESLQGRARGAARLRQRVLDQTLSAADRLPWSKLVRPHRALFAVAAAGLLLSGAGLATRWWPEIVTVGLPRYGWPFADVEWPRRVAILPLSADLIVPVGEAAAVQMRVVRGNHENLRGWVVWQEAGQPQRRELMRRTASGEFEFRLENVQAPLSYWFESGDDSTRDRPGSIRVVERPDLAAASVRFRPPPYATVLGETEVSLASGRAVALEGSDASLALEFTRPLAFDGPGAPRLRITDRAGTALRCDQADPTGSRWRCSFTLDGPMTLDVAAADQLGLTLRGDVRFEFEVRRDGPPTVSITQPAPLLEVTPAATVSVKIVAEDDIDVVAVDLRAHLVAGSALPDRSAWKGSARSAGDKSGRAQLTVTEMWPLAELGLVPGQTVEYWAEARDGFELGGRRHEPARSPVLRLRVISAQDFADRMRDEFASLRRRLQRLADDQDALRQQTEVRAAATSPADVAPLLGRQRATVAAAEELAGRFEALVERMAENRVEGGATAEQAEQIAAAIRNVADGAMARAIERLREWARLSLAGGAASQPADLAATEAVASQRDATDALRRLLAGVQRWTDFDGIVGKTRDLLDRQEALQRQTVDAAADTAGQAPDQLGPAQRDRLIDVAARQELVARDLADMLAGLDRLAESLAVRDRPAADALRRGHEAADQEDVLERMRAAADAIRRNQGLRADEAQGAAARGLRAILAALSEKVDRELAELTRRLQDAAAQLDRLIAAQQDLNTRTRQAAAQPDAAGALPDLAPRQGTLQRTALRLADQVDQELPDAGSAASAVRTASGAMDRARHHLDEAAAESASAAQVEALAALRQAASGLTEMHAQAEEERAARSLERTREELDAIRDAQDRLIARTDAVETRRAAAKRLSRADGIELNRLSREQAELRQRLAALADALTGAVVFVFVCNAAGEDMARAVEALDRREPGPAAVHQRRAAAALGDLLKTLDELPRKARLRFADAQPQPAGDGQGGSRDAAPPVPPLAELRMLRRLQDQLNAATRDFDATAPPAADRSEDDLRRIAQLGREQRQLRDLAIRLVSGKGQAP